MVPVPSGKLRPGVVLRIIGDQAVVAYCTGTQRDDRLSLKVAQGTTIGSSLKLEKTSYFFEDAVGVCLTSTLQPAQGRCPPGFFLELRALTERAVANLWRALSAPSQNTPSPPAPIGPGEFVTPSGTFTIKDET